MLRRPSIPCGAIVILLHQDSEKCVIVQPCGFFLAKFSKAGLSIFAGMTREIRECFLQQRPLQRFDVAIFHPAAPESSKVHIGGDGIEIFPRQIFRRSGREIECCWINRHRADRIVRAVVAAGFIDRQKLDQLETNPARPIDELAQPIDIADAEIVFRPQSEERCQHSRDFLIGRQIHRGEISAASDLPVFQQLRRDFS